MFFFLPWMVGVLCLGGCALLVPWWDNFVPSLAPAGASLCTEGPRYLRNTGWWVPVRVPIPALVEARDSAGFPSTQQRDNGTAVVVRPSRCCTRSPLPCCSCSLCCCYGPSGLFTDALGPTHSWRLLNSWRQMSQLPRQPLHERACRFLPLSNADPAVCGAPVRSW